MSEKTNMTALDRITEDPLVLMHAVLTVVIAWWALTLDLTDNTSPSLLRIMPGAYWHIVLTLGAVVGLFGLMNKRLCKVSTQVLSFLHGVIALAIIVHTPWAPWSAPYATLALFSGYLVWRRRI